MQRASLDRRLRRRNTHRSRSVAVSVSLAVLALVAIWIGLEAVLAAVGARPLLVDPQSAIDAALRPNTAGSTITVAAAVVLAVIGIVLVVLAVAPGRLHRRPVSRARAVVVVDDRIVASTAVGVAGATARLPQNQIEAWTRGRTVEVRIRPTSGIPVDADAVRTAVTDRLGALDQAVARRVRVDIAERGVIA